MLFAERHFFNLFNEFEFDTLIEFMSWILEMLITWSTILPPHVISMGTDSCVHTCIQLWDFVKRKLGVCKKEIFLSRNHPAAFACNKVSNIKCFSRDNTLNHWCWDYLLATKVYCSSQKSVNKITEIFISFEEIFWANKIT